MDKKIIRFESTTKDEASVVSELQCHIAGSKVGLIIFFCSSEYNLDVLERLLVEGIPFDIAGCTTAGEIGTHYQTGGFVALCFLEAYFHVQVHLIEKIDDFGYRDALAIADKSAQNLAFNESLDRNNMFGFVLIDGLSMMEEIVIGLIYRVLENVPIAGGSAGDDLKFLETKVYAQGQFHSNAAVFFLVESKVPFEVFNLQHFIPSDKELVVTESDAKHRIVSEINGGVAADEYAAVIGVDVNELSEHIFAMHPLVLQVGDQWYVRSIKTVNADGTLVFSSAIDVGLPLTVAKGKHIVETLSHKVAALQKHFSSIDATLGCDCILRRLELQQKGLEEGIEEELQKIKFTGFSSYGEQYNWLHVNQTLTAITIGAKAGGIDE